MNASSNDPTMSTNAGLEQKGKLLPWRIEHILRDIEENNFDRRSFNAQKQLWEKNMCNLEIDANLILFVDCFCCLFVCLFVCFCARIIALLSSPCWQSRAYKSGYTHIRTLVKTFTVWVALCFDRPKIKIYSPSKC